MDNSLTQKTKAQILAGHTYELRRAYKAYKEKPSHETADTFYKKGMLIYQTHALYPALEPMNQIAFDCWRETFAERFAFHKLREEKIITCERSNTEGKNANKRFNWHTNHMMKLYDEYRDLPDDARTYDRNRAMKRFIEQGQAIDGKYEVGEGFAMSNETFEVYSTCKNFEKYHGLQLQSKQKRKRRLAAMDKHGSDLKCLRDTWDEFTEDREDPKKLARFLHYGAKIFVAIENEDLHISPAIKEILTEFEAVIITDPEIVENTRGYKKFRLPDDKLSALKEKHNPTVKADVDAAKKGKDVKKPKENLDKSCNKYGSTELNEFADAADFYDFYVASEDGAETIIWREFPEIQAEAVTILRTAGDAVREYLKSHEGDSVPPELSQFYSIYLGLPPALVKTNESKDKAT
jgi:hypothetical protein